MQTSRNIAISKLANVIGVHRNTLSRRIRQLGLNRKYTELTDMELEQILKEYRLKRPNSGITYVTSYLRSQGLRIQRWRVRNAIQNVDGVGVRIRKRTAINRRAYTNPRPMAVWHCDGHHKAIHWGIVVHGFIDGYSRKVMAKNFLY
jgi:hypothetical protein